MQANAGRDRFANTDGYVQIALRRGQVFPAQGFGNAYLLLKANPCLLIVLRVARPIKLVLRVGSRPAILVLGRRFQVLVAAPRGPAALVLRWLFFRGVAGPRLPVTSILIGGGAGTLVLVISRRTALGFSGRRTAL